MKEKKLLKLSIVLVCLMGTSLIAKQSVYAKVPAKQVTPKDGTWKAKLLSHRVIGCPPMLKSMISKLNLKTNSKRIKFSKPFHPRSLFEESGQLKWKKIGTNKWRASMHQGGGGMNMNISWSLGVISKTKMNVSSKINMKLPPQMASMFGGSKECKTNTFGSYNYIGK